MYYWVPAVQRLLKAPPSPKAPSRGVEVEVGDGGKPAATEEGKEAAMGVKEVDWCGHRCCRAREDAAEQPDGFTR